MLTDHLYDYLAGVQRTVARYGGITAFAVVLGVVILVVAVDYARMLWLRRKIVSNTLKENDTRLTKA